MKKDLFFEYPPKYHPHHPHRPDDGDGDGDATGQPHLLSDMRGRQETQLLTRHTTDTRDAWTQSYYRA